ncbi:hypothetical protein ACOSQ2_001053 [Xanthoceras sorbifolium]
MRETINKWVSSPQVEIQTIARRMIAKFEKYWTVLDPRYKMLRVEFHFRKLYGFDTSCQLNKVTGLLNELFKEYESKVLTGSTLVEQVEDSSSCDHSIKVLADNEEYEEFKSQAISRMNKSELETYLSEQVEDNLSNFNILSWWKVNKRKYPILVKIARDMLAIPVSTVASESAFSTGGRFLSLHRKRLHPDTLEALMCAQN